MYWYGQLAAPCGTLSVTGQGNLSLVKGTPRVAIKDTSNSKPKSAWEHCKGVNLRSRGWQARVAFSGEGISPLHGNTKIARLTVPEKVLLRFVTAVVAVLMSNHSRRRRLQLEPYFQRDRAKNPLPFTHAKKCYLQQLVYCLCSFVFPLLI